MSGQIVHKSCVKSIHVPALVRAGHNYDVHVVRVSKWCNTATNVALMLEILQNKRKDLARACRHMSADVSGWYDWEVEVIRPIRPIRRVPTGNYDIYLVSPHVVERLIQSNGILEAHMTDNFHAAFEWFHGNAYWRGSMLLKELCNETPLRYVMLHSRVDIVLSAGALMSVPVDMLDRVIVGLYTARVRFVP